MVPKAAEVTHPARAPAAHHIVPLDTERAKATPFARRPNDRRAPILLESRPRPAPAANHIVPPDTQPAKTTLFAGRPNERRASFR
jgi:hypothetical protein